MLKLEAFSPLTRWETSTNVFYTDLITLRKLLKIAELKRL